MIRSPHVALSAAGVASFAVLVALTGCGDRSADDVDRALDEGRFDAAWQLAHEVVLTDSTSAAAWIGLARAGLATLRTATGTDAATRATELDPTNAHAWLVLAYLNQRLGPRARGSCGPTSRRTGIIASTRRDNRDARTDG